VNSPSANVTSLPLSNLSYNFITIPKPQVTSFAVPVSADSSVTAGAVPSQVNTTLLSAILCAIFGFSC
jgi:predicted regulator of Ras-like GTPase activity (Roadblock/LC7/MglB family)